MGAFSRMKYVIAANVNALLERAEDPEKLLRALIREMEDAGEDARLATADLLAEQKHAERVADRLEREVGEWQERAEKAVASGREDLARTALAAKAEVTEQLEAARDEQAILTERTAQLERDMATLKAKLAEAKGRLADMQKRGVSTAARAVPPEPKSSKYERRLRESMHRFDRLQSQVDRLEARVKSYEVGGVAPSPWPGPSEPDPAIEEELAEIRSRVGGSVSEAVEAVEQAAEEVTEAVEAAAEEISSETKKEV